MNYRRSTWLPLLLLLAPSCGERGSGVLSADSRTVASFLAIDNRGQANVYVNIAEVTDTAETRLTISGDDNLLAAVVTRVDGETLIVDTDHSLLPAHELRVVASVGLLAEITSSGSGDVHADGVSGDLALQATGSGEITASGELDQVLVRAAGSGDVALSGTATLLDAVISGSGDLAALGMTVLDAEVVVTGSGDVELCVTGALEATIAGSGDIDYHCDPETVHPHLSGSGTLGGH